MPIVDNRQFVQPTEIVTVTAAGGNIPVDENERLVLVDGTAAAATTITLPASTDYPFGYTVTVKDIDDASAFNITVAAAAGDALVGTGTIAAQFGAITYVLASANTWITLSRTTA